jgi:hypothetical protein
MTLSYRMLYSLHAFNPFLFGIWPSLSVDRIRHTANVNSKFDFYDRAFQVILAHVPPLAYVIRDASPYFRMLCDIRN